MTVQANERPFVLEVEDKSVSLRAYLYNFKIDSDLLLPEHITWLDREVRKHVVFSTIGPSDHWTVWLMGTASTTGSWSHNTQLSWRRAKAVENHLRTHLPRRDAEAQTLRIRYDTNWAGEAFAAMSGKPDELEDPSDRAVQIALGVSFGPKPKPPAPIQRPEEKFCIPCCLVQLEMEYFGVAKDAWSVNMRSGFRDTGGGRTTKPHRDLFVTGLTGKGWSRERAWELYESGPYSRVPIEEAMGATGHIDRVVSRLKSNLRNCCQGDPNGVCARSTLRKRGSVGPRDNSLARPRHGSRGQVP